MDRARQVPGLHQRDGCTTSVYRSGQEASPSQSSSDLSPLDAAPELLVPDDEQGEGRLSSILPIHLPNGGLPEIEPPEQRLLLAHRHRLTPSPAPVRLMMGLLSGVGRV
jgi:hypothetical protein